MLVILHGRFLSEYRGLCVLSSVKHYRVTNAYAHEACRGICGVGLAKEREMGAASLKDSMRL